MLARVCLTFNDQQRKMKKLISLLGFAFASLVSAADATPSFTTTHIPGVDFWQFLFPSIAAERYYTESFLAVKIEAIYADGVELVAEPHDSPLKHHIEGRTYRPILPTKMLYRLDSREFISVASRDKSGDLNLVKYTIPLDAAKIEISYRIRFPDGKISAPMQLISLSSYDFKAVDDKQEPTQSAATPGS